MNLKNIVIRAMIRLLLGKYPYQVRDIMIGSGHHVHKNPVKRKKPLPLFEVKP